MSFQLLLQQDGCAIRLLLFVINLIVRCSGIAQNLGQLKGHSICLSIYGLFLGTQDLNILVSLVIRYVINER